MKYNHQGITKNWKLLAEGERQGLYSCFTLFYDDLYRFGMSQYRDPELIKESIQNLFIELWQIRARLGEIENIQQYVFTVYKRVIYKTYQKEIHKDPDKIVHMEDLNEQYVSVHSYEAILIASQEDEQLRKRLEHALDKLTPRQKEMVQLRYFECLSFKDISHKTGLTERTVYNTLHNAVNVLRDHLLSVLILTILGEL